MNSGFFFACMLLGIAWFSLRKLILWRRWEKVGKLYIGNYSRSLDEKGRLQIPPALFDDSAKELFILRGLDGCVSVYGEESFNELLGKLRQLDFLDEKQRAFIRLSSASMKRLKVDSHGRITIGKDVLAEYGIDTEVKIIGVIDHFEIWAPLGYAKYQLAYDRDYEKLAKGN